MADLTAIASEIEKGLETFMKVEPILANVAGVIPGAGGAVAVAQPIIMMAVPFLEQALKAIATKNGGDVFSAMVELLQHINPNMPNSPTLDGSAKGPITN